MLNYESSDNKLKVIHLQIHSFYSTMIPQNTSLICSMTEFVYHSVRNSKQIRPSEIT